MLSEWTAMWKVVLPGFEPDSLWMERKMKWSPSQVSNLEDNPEHEETDSDLAFRILGVTSPDGARVLDIDSYQVIEPEGDSLEVGGEPDSRPVLIDRRARTETIVEFCGTSCGYHWAKWLSPAGFALGGWQNADDYGHWDQGTLSIYSLRDSTVAVYVTRIIPASDFERYLSAWRGWLMKRYRALKIRA